MTNPSSKLQKTAVIVVGGMGAGKSTAINKYFQSMNIDAEEIVRGGYDDVMQALSQYKAYLRHRSDFAPDANGNAQSGEKWEHMIGPMGSCAPVIRPLAAQIEKEAVKRGLPVLVESFIGIPKIVSFAGHCYDITIVSVSNDPDTAMCRVLQRQDHEQRFKEVKGVKQSYEMVKDDFLATRTFLIELFSEKGYWDHFDKSKPGRFIKMCDEARFHLFNCKNSGKTTECKHADTSASQEPYTWADVWNAWIQRQNRMKSRGAAKSALELMVRILMQFGQTGGSKKE